ncbi:MAG: hypothetical protein M3288_05945 [Thermoproteota archaeon]|nr:hypothetical protein [Thermoproteota archaeon]
MSDYQVTSRSVFCSSIRLKTNPRSPIDAAIPATGTAAKTTQCQRGGCAIVQTFKHILTEKAGEHPVSAHTTFKHGCWNSQHVI